jgi:hypothetical protein
MAKRSTANKKSRKKRDGSYKRQMCSYDGSDPRTKWIICMNPNCRRRNAFKRLCSRNKDAYVKCPRGCETFYYCSAICAQKNSGHLVMECEKLRKLRSDIKLLSQNVDVMMTLADPTKFGNISKRRHPAAFAFLATRSNLANELVKVARQHHIGSIWNEAMAIMKENLRLSHFHLKDKPIKAWCYQFATCLLDAGHLDYVISFTTYLINRFLNSSSEVLDESVDGVWIYPRYHNLPSLSNNQVQRVDLYLFFVMFVAKLKQISAFTLLKKMVRLFRVTDCFRIIEGFEGPLGMILDYLIPCQIGPIVTWKSFKESCEGLSSDLSSMSNILMDRNPYLFDEIIALRSNTSKNVNGSDTDHYMEYLPGSKEFARECVKNCRYSLATIPNLEFWI